MGNPTGGLTAWFGKGPKGDWVDIGAPKVNGRYQACGRSKLAKDKKENIQNAFLVQLQIV